jgi:predicted GNAT superfamily acetyltransferase
MNAGAIAAGTTTAGMIQVRKCHTLDEMSACVALQKEVWNFADAELMPLRLFVVAEKIGGQVIGAFDSGRMVGFGLSLPGVRGGHSYLHSQMLAVASSYRNGGLGRQIKLFQREDAVALGFELIEWTFDPLEIKNAYLNIERLGAIARRYHVNQYGVTSSPLQGGLPSDRLVAEWWLKSKRVENLLGLAPDDPRQATTMGKSRLSSFETLKTIAVPAEIYDWKASSATRNRAREVQERNRRDFREAFSEGLTILGYERDTARNGKFLLGRWDETWAYWL